jgi:hypothetical protein
MSFLSRPPSFFIGIAINAIMLSLSWAVPMIFPSTSHNGIIIAIIGIVISLPFFVWAYASYKGKKEIKDILPTKARGKVMIFSGSIFIIIGFLIVISQLDFQAPPPKPAESKKEQLQKQPTVEKTPQQPNIFVSPSSRIVNIGMDEEFIMKVTNDCSYPLGLVQVKIRLDAGDLPLEDILISPDGIRKSPDQFQKSSGSLIQNAVKDSLKVILFNDNGRVLVRQLLLKQKGELFTLFYVEDIDPHSTKSFPVIIQKARTKTQSKLSFSIRASCKNYVTRYTAGERQIILPREGHHENCE